MHSKTILIVDDDHFFREILKEALWDRYKVFEASCGEEAIALTNDIRPDLIILDIEMPGINGIETCRKLKEAEQTRCIPLILLSSRTREDEVIRGLQAGADDYLTKPIRSPEILARIDAHLRSKGYYDELERRDLRMLLGLSDAVSALRNPMKILRMTVEKMTDVLEVERCSILGINKSGELLVRASSDLAENTELKLNLDRYPEIGKALETRRTVVVNDIKNDPLMAPVRRFVKDLDFNSIIVVPIIKKERILGTLFLRTASALRGGISGRIYNLCHVVAGISAKALENALLFDSMNTAQEYLKEMAIRDGLTGLYTHQHFYERLDEEFSRALRYREPLSLIFFDVDNFKRINDSYGHVRGDEVLRKTGLLVKEVLRESDIPARYGGEEFAVMLPSTGREGALKMAWRLAAIIRKQRFENMNGERVTISTGISTFYGDNFQSFDQMVRLADEAMYRAKKGGKDRIAMASDPSRVDEPPPEA